MRLFGRAVVVVATTAVTLVTGAVSAAPTSADELAGQPDDAAAASVPVLLTNDGTLPVGADLALITATTGVDRSPEEDARPTLAELLGAATVTELGPAIPAGLPAPPVPAEYLTAENGEPGLTLASWATDDPDDAPAATTTTLSTVATTTEGAAMVRLTGQLTVPTDGHYVFTLAASGTARLVLGDEEAALEPEQPPRAPHTTSPGVDEESTDPPPGAVPPPLGDHLAHLSIELDLEAGEVLPVLVEHHDSSPPAAVALGWRPPPEVLPTVLMQAIDAARGADAVIVTIPETIAAGAVTTLALPFDHADLFRRLAEVNPRLVVVLDARSDPSFRDWAATPAAILHCPAGCADPEETADLIRGRQQPRGQLRQPLPQPADGTDPPGPLFETDHGLTYWDFTVEAARATVTPEPAQPALPAVTLTADVAARGTASAAVTVTVIASTAAGATSVPAGAAEVTPEPGSTASVDIPLDLSALLLEPDVTWPVTLHVSTPGQEEPVTVEIAQPSPPAVPDDSLDAQAPEGRDSGDGPRGESSAAPREPSDPETSRPDAGPAAQAGQESETGAPDLAAAPEPEDRPVPAAAPPALTLTLAGNGAHLDGARRDGASLLLSGELPGVTVVDRRTRPGSGWTVVAQASELAGAAGTVPARALGWRPLVTAATDGVVAGPEVPSALGGGPGLAAASVLGTADRDADTGVTTFGADLQLRVPVDTPPGHYGGTLTVTLFPNE